jgi:uncharacterized protein YcfJ
MNALARKLLHLVIAASLAAGLAACGSGATDASITAAPGEATTPAGIAADAAPEPATDAPRYADVISVQPVKQSANREREECRDEQVTHRRKPRDEHQIAGTVIGAVAGGAVGNQVGGGRGRDLATVAGAIGGGVAGKKIQEKQQRGDTYTTTERRCRMVTEPGGEIVAYDVVYAYLGQTHEVRLDHDPGDRLELPVRGL